MKRILLLSIFILACAWPTFAQQEKEPVKLPAAQAEKIKQAEARIAEHNREIENLRLLEQNALLDAALELELTKKQLEGLRLSMNDKGELVLVEQPKSNKPPGKSQ
jgi:hypothetical protein